MFNQLITQAIKERRKLHFTYHGKSRVVDPHVFGISTKGNKVVLCWQTGGFYSKNDLPNWRMFETHEIQGLRIGNECFTPQLKRHNKYESNIQTVYATI
jgi:hypothetical protein